MKTNYKHLTLDDRYTIQHLLEAGANVTQIAKILGKHRTSIAKEIKLHRLKKLPVSYGVRKTPCAIRKDCLKLENHQCNVLSCADFVEEICPATLKSPFVCNGCERKSFCRYTRYFYYADRAHSLYRSTLKSSREGVGISEDKVYEINEVIKPLIVDKGHSVHQVYVNHSDILTFSKSTFYKYIDEGVLNIKNIDLPRRVRYKARRKKNTPKEPRNTAIRVGRTYDDYLHYVNTHPNANIVQMDTVIGISGSKGGICFLTLLFTRSNFMLILPIPYCRSTHVTEHFYQLKGLLGSETFDRLFEVILTDNGSEFSDPVSIEANLDTGELTSHVFYCDPSSAWQKGALEKNHEYIRYILPKGTSFAGFNLQKCNILASHINSVPRKSLNDHTPYEIACMTIGENIIKKLQIEKIKADDVILSPALAKMLKS